MTNRYTVAYPVTTSYELKTAPKLVTEALMDKIQCLLNLQLAGVTHFYTSEDPVLEDCIVALRLIKTDSGFIIEHWNYHPARKEIQHTHTTKLLSALDGRYWVTQHDPEKAAIETFKSLKRLYSQV